MESTRIELKKGTTLFNEGDTPDFAYLIESGEIEISSNKGNEKLVLAILDSGDLLGEMAVIDDSPRNADAIAHSDCVLMQISKEQVVERIVKSDPIVRSLLIGLLRRYRSTLATLKGEEEEMIFSETSLFDRITIDKIRLEGQLREAIANNSLDLRFQPITYIENGNIAGYEALVRWNHPEHGFVSPEEFVSLAEETSLIFEVGAYVIETSCKAAEQLIEKGIHDKVFMAVNVSARQLAHPDLVSNIVDCLKAYGLPNNTLKLEITEGLALDKKEVQRTIQEAHKYGLEVALDDFGTGYSNLTLLHELNFDTIKIDQAFARGITKDSRSMLLVKTINDMCKSLDANVLVEGIENEVMLEMVKDIGATYGQGYHIGKPQTLEDLLNKK